MKQILVLIVALALSSCTTFYEDFDDQSLPRSSIDIEIPLDPSWDLADQSDENTAGS
ncbi:MAG: hypothetical protein SNF60_08080 [Rikenellaceae bacterium]